MAKKTIKERTVGEAPIDHLWILDVRGASSIAELVEYLDLTNFSLQLEIEDVHIWSRSPLG
jgi:hypothetical protein